MKTWFKQLFCSHIYKDDKEKFLENKYFPDNPHIIYSCYSKYAIYAVFKHCIKCDKQHITIKRKLII